MIKFKRFFVDNDDLYGVSEDNSLWKFGEDWGLAGYVEVRCPECDKVLEPHICKDGKKGK